jgi:hypothetical protein
MNDEAECNIPLLLPLIILTQELLHISKVIIF